MPRKYSEDYFEHTKMTFGEHLEELRRSLWKAVLSLVIGFVVGLWFGKDIVKFIEVPVTEALEDYYLDKAVADQSILIAQRDGRDEPTDEDVAQAERVIRDGGLTFEKKLFEREALVGLLADVLIDLHPDQADEIRRWIKRRADAVEKAAQDPNQSIRDRLVEFVVYSDIEKDIRVRMISTGVHEPFVVYVKASLLFGAVVSSPFVFYFVWQFVAAGLYPHEKNSVFIFGPFSLGLFLAGAALAFFAVIGFVLDFLFGFNAAMGIDPDPRISEWLSFVMLLPVGFGISFQLPLVMLFLERIGIMSVKTYIDKWRISVLVISILSMVLTPADPGSMILMFVPLTLLYFFGIGLCRFWPKRKTPFGEEIE
jgi:sec-independent protein translocase protein TatC